MTVAHCLQKTWNYVTEYMWEGDMATQLIFVERYSEEESQFYAAELTLAVEFLHKCGIIHR